jgi:probable phosphoglycerate mutase
MLLIRHGDTDAVGRCLAGRATGVPLNARGHEQARDLGDALRGVPLRAVFTSPLERAFQTASAVARPHGLCLDVRERLTDVDFGEWTGIAIDALDTDPRWHAFNRDRERAAAPGGEALRAVAARVRAALEAIEREARGPLVALVTHAEPIRCTIAAAGGLSLDAALSVPIDTASVSILEREASNTRVVAVNLTPAEAGAVLGRMRLQGAA